MLHELWVWFIPLTWHITVIYSPHMTHNCEHQVLLYCYCLCTTNKSHLFHTTCKAVGILVPSGLVKTLEWEKKPLPNYSYTQRQGQLAIPPDWGAFFQQLFMSNPFITHGPFVPNNLPVTMIDSWLYQSLHLIFVKSFPNGIPAMLRKALKRPTALWCFWRDRTLNRRSRKRGKKWIGICVFLFCLLFQECGLKYYKRSERERIKSAAWYQWPLSYFFLSQLLPREKLLLWNTIK